uniref:NADH-ubiquinone oxidoreductase chain 4L n=1 Tax=Potamotyphlus kaupii TaxID=3372812 RepID=W5RHE9_9AMPH|nr:NADH dehydrogenase subunit 4L [Potomotyphlus kaupii]AGZ19080.1 NADH dehydrogenase subunit 4L [Potomotyphlus kaupii]
MTPTHFIIYSAFMIGLTGMAFHRTHMMSALICLEGMMLSLFIGITLWLMTNSTALSPAPMILLTLSACEAGSGLAILVATSRTHGTDLMKTMNMLRC